MNEKVVVITTGGTIEMAHANETEGIKIQDQRTLQKTLPLLNQYGEVEMEYLFNLPSPHRILHLLKWRRLPSGLKNT